MTRMVSLRHQGRKNKSSNICICCRQILERGGHQFSREQEYWLDDYVFDKPRNARAPRQHRNINARNETVHSWSTRPRRKHLKLFRQRYEEGDSTIGTLGEPSRKFDYYKSYIPLPSYPHDIIPSNWGEESHDVDTGSYNRLMQSHRRRSLKIPNDPPEGQRYEATEVQGQKENITRT